MKEIAPRVMNALKRYIAFVLVITVCVLPAIAQGTPDVVEPTEQFYVADYADVIDEATEQLIVEKAAKLCEENGAQVVVVTVDFIGESTIEEYARTLFNKWGIGDKDKNNGVLLLMVIGEENYWCVQGSGLEEKLTTSAIKNILDLCLEPDFAKQDYSRGAYLFHNAVCVRLRQIDKKEREAKEQEQEAEEKEREAEERYNWYLEQLENEEKAEKRRRFWNNVWETIKFIFAILMLAFFVFVFIIWCKPDSEEKKKRKEYEAQLAKEREERIREIRERYAKAHAGDSGCSIISASSGNSGSNCEATARLRDALTRITDPELKTYVRRIERALTRMIDTAAQKPTKAAYVKKFVNYYLPTIVKLLDAYDCLCEAGQADTMSATLQSIENSMSKVADAAEKQLTNMFEDDQMEISIDIEVLENMLKSDGLLDDEAFEKTKDAR